MSVKAINAKETFVHEISENLKIAKSFVVFEYSGLTAAEITNLRFELNKNNSKLKILKNNILSRALQEANISGFNELMSGPNAIVIAYDDEISPFKAISEIAKKCDCVKVKGAYFEKSFMGVAQFNEIAKIPGREGLYSMLLSCLQSPIRSFLYGIKAVSETKNN